MAHKKRSKSRSETPLDVSNSVATNPVPRTVRNYQPENFYREVADNRRWDPDPLGRAKTLSGARPRIIAKQPNVNKKFRVIRGPGGRPLSSKNLVHGINASGVTSRLRFKVPHDVLVCLRRKIRREVLHALKLKKSGGGGRRRRNQYSDIEC